MRVRVKPLVMRSQQHLVEDDCFRLTRRRVAVQFTATNASILAKEEVSASHPVPEAARSFPHQLLAGRQLIKLFKERGALQQDFDQFLMKIGDALGCLH